jgi:hypothetical protein
VSGTGYRRGGSWNTNQKMMLVICSIIWTVWLIVMISAWSNGAAASDMIFGGVCFGIFGMVPLVILLVSRNRARGPKTRTDLVKSQSMAPQGHVNTEISAYEKFPKICVCCGEKTGRVSKFHYRGANSDANAYRWSRVHPVLMVLLFWFFAAQVLMAKVFMIFERLRNQHRSSKGDIEFRIPHCRNCVRNLPILQRHFDFHSRRMTIATAPEFATSLKAMRNLTKNPQ